MAKLLEELRGIFQASGARLRAEVEEGLKREAQKKAAKRWACDAYPFVVEALRRAAAAGAESAELLSGSTTLPRRMRKPPPGGLEELGRILEKQDGLRTRIDRGLVVSWE